MIRVFLATLALAASVASAQQTQRAPAGSRGVRVHDPSSIIECDGEYWIFCTGSGVRAYRSRDLRAWTTAPRVLAELPRWAQKYLKDDRLWAPDVIRSSAGRFLLYYSASSWGKNTSAIGLLSNETLVGSKGRWVDEGIVIASTPANDFNAIDPAVTLDADGKLWLSFGSFWSGIKLTELDPGTGKRITADSPIHSLARAKEIEAPFIHRRGEEYYLFVNFGLCCRGVKSTYEICVGRSDRIIGPYVDRDGKNMRDAGGTLVLGSTPPFIGPGHASIFADKGREWFACHFYDATQNGRGTLAIRPLSWTADGWPKVGE